MGWQVYDLRVEIGGTRDVHLTGLRPCSPAAILRSRSRAQHCATVCYMSDKDRPARVGVRELRQNLSVYLDRVKAGETLEVTEHGQPVAQLGPRHATPASIIDRLIAEGRITPAATDHRTLTPPPPNMDTTGRTLSEVLQDMRDEEYR